MIISLVLGLNFCIQITIFLYSDNHLAKNISQCEIPEEEDSSGELSSASEHVQNATPTPKKGLKEVSYENECEQEASLSWLKNASVINEEKEASHNQIPYLRESPEEILRLLLLRCGMAMAYQIQPIRTRKIRK